MVNGYDAEISGSNSGVIKRTLKQGPSSYSGSFSLQNDGPGSGESFFGDNVTLMGINILSLLSEVL